MAVTKWCNLLPSTFRPDQKLLSWRCYLRQPIMQKDMAVMNITRYVYSSFHYFRKMW